MKQFEMQDLSVEGHILDAMGWWFSVGLITLMAYLMWAIIAVQNHYYFTTVPFSYQGVPIP